MNSYDYVLRGGEIAALWKFSSRCPACNDPEETSNASQGCVPSVAGAPGCPNLWPAFLGRTLPGLGAKPSSRTLGRCRSGQKAGKNLWLCACCYLRSHGSC